MGTLYWGVGILVTPLPSRSGPDGRRRYPGARGSWLLLALCTAGPAHALDGDRIRPFIGVVATYYSNLFFTDERIPTTPLFKGVESDLSYGLRGGVNADYYLSRQKFSVNATATESQFQKNGNLDNIAYNARGVMNWVIGSDWEGDLAAAYTQSLGSFADTRINAKNIRTTESFSGSAMYRMYYDWKLRGAITQTILENGAVAFQAGNRNDLIYEFGTRYYSKGGDNFLGLNFKTTDGQFPNREFVPGLSRVNSSFLQYDLQGTVDWRYSGETKISGAVGWTNRLHSEVSERNFAGLTGRIAVSYSLSGRTTINAAVRRDVGALEDVTSNFVLTQGFSIGPTYALTGKMSLTANYDYNQRKFLGDPGFIVSGIPARVDDIQTLSINLGYAATRNGSVNVSLSQSMRGSNRPFSDYNATTLTVSGQLTF